MRQNPWFQRFKPNPSARFRLFCFPYAGGNAGLYEPWSSAFDGVEVVAVQLPGRSNRFNERPLESVPEVVAQLVQGWDAYRDLPFVFFGHSNGALICFELARELQRRGIGGLAHIILSAKRAAHLPRRRPTTFDLPYDEFIAELRSINGTPREVLENRQLMDLFVPVLRADFRMNETHRYVADVRLRCAASLFNGTLDHDLPSSDVLAWKELIDADELEYIEFPGDHFFIHSLQSRVLSEIGAVLDRLRHGRVSTQVSARDQLPA